MRIIKAIHKLLTTPARDSPAPQVSSGIPPSIHGAIGTVPNYRWMIMGLWSTIVVTGFAMALALGIMLPAISEELHLSPSQQGLLGSAAFLGSACLSIPITWWASRFAPKILTTLTLALGGVFLILQAWAPSFAVLLISRVGFGLTLVAREPAVVHIVEQWFTKREVVLVNSVRTALFGFCVGGGFILTPLAMSGVGGNWRVVLYLFGGITIIMVLVWIALGREIATRGYRSKRDVLESSLFKGALGHRDLWIGGLGFLGATTTWSAFLSFYPTLMLGKFDISLQWSGTILALGIMVGGGAGLGVGYIVTMADRRKLILMICGLVMASTFIGMTMSGSVTVLIVLSFLNGISWGFWPILHTIPFQLPGIRSREVAIAIGFTMTLSTLGAMIGPLATGFLQETMGELSMALMVVSFAPLSITAAGFFLQFRPDTASQVPTPASKLIL